MGDAVVGRLALGFDRLCRFEYDVAWLANAYSISPFVLPLRKELFVAKRDPFDGLFGVFADSMPDGWGNLLLDRYLQSRGVKLASLSVLDRLALVGAGGMGALRYEPDKSVGLLQDAAHLLETSEQVAAILAEKADVPTVKALLEQTGSSGGARPKVIVRHDGRAWLVKFASSADSAEVGQEEFFYAQLARLCGILMPETLLFEGRFFGTQLFDRNETGRVLMHSASGLLYASHRFPSLDYRDLAKATWALTRSMPELGRLLRLMVFNVLIGNMDDHAKNFSFLRKEGSWVLSPGYDLLRSDGFGGEHATAVAGLGKPTREALFEVAQSVGFPRREMVAIFEHVTDVCLASEIGASVRKLNL
jgi:serine/threonine-protein kinase HipA